MNSAISTDDAHRSPLTEQTEMRARAQAATAERRARSLTDSRSREESVENLTSWLSRTPLAELAALARDEDDLRTLAHTLELNDGAMDWLFAHVSDPLELAYAVATTTQRSLHTFIHPVTGKRTRNLTGAKRAGAFFTPPSVAHEMAELALYRREFVRHALEPASGTAMLTAALLVVASRQHVGVATVSAWELSPYLAGISQRVIEAVIDRLGIETASDVRIGDAIALFTENAARPDVLVMNPPYGRVKYLRSEATNAETRALDAPAAVAAGREWVDSTRSRYAATVARLGLSPRGLDHQRIFMAAGASALVAGGRMVCIAPSSWMSGIQSRDVRAALLPDRMVDQIILYREDAKLFPTVNQPTAVVAIDADGGHHSIEITTSDLKNGDRVKHEVSYTEIFEDQEQLAVPVVPAAAQAAFSSARKLPRIGDLDIKNARGELDLSLDAWMLTDTDGVARVVRGDHVKHYELLSAMASSKSGMLSERGQQALRERAKWPDSRQPRIVGRQVAYMGKARRMTFAEVPEGTVVSNSCNYLLADDPLLRSALLGYLNSAPAEWFFRIRSSNNHVSNGEIAGLPWPLQDPSVLEAVSASASIRARATGEGKEHLARRVDDVIDALVCFAFGWSATAARPILEEVLSSARVDSVAALVEWLRRFGVPDHLRSSATWMQHELNTLSALDYEMISHVPMGGNWQHIPESVPSKRLEQIREMSKARGIVRTTYYGRLRADQPSYTIATYYNRPGNGTNIHPFEDRTLSHREAARLQSFPDAYGFVGGDGAIRKQIGNAVPPLLGRAVASALRESGVGTDGVVDLFAGAGGLSLGFELAGFNVAVAADNNEPALRTYAFNRATESIADASSRRTLLIGSDLSRASVREDVYASIRQKLNGSRPSALIGGPPCQGFSYAGFRDPTDVRSDLAVAFLDFVEALEPAAVVIENVEGLLTARGGSVLKELLSTLEELGYPVASPWVLAAEQFGVPQMRRRVFLVAQRHASVAPPRALFDRCLGRREVVSAVRNERYPVTVAEALGDLPAITGQQPKLMSQSRAGFTDWVSGRADLGFLLTPGTEEVDLRS